MVQYHDFHSLFGGQQYYWKLDSGSSKDTRALLDYLQSKNYKCTSKGLTRLRELYIHCQRGYISYEGLPVSELRLFIAGRGLPTITDSKHTRTLLKAQLEQADEDATFDRFLDLPPEIRCQVFEHYFDWLSRPAHPYSPIGPQPPVTRASKQTRDEALPLFYSRSCFSLNAHSDGRLHEPSAQFVSNTLAAHIARIQFLEVLFNHGLNYYLKIKVRIDINDRACPARVTNVGVEKDIHFSPPSSAIDLATVATQEIDEFITQEQHPFIRDIATQTDRFESRKDDVLTLIQGVRDSVIQGLESVEISSLLSDNRVLIYHG